MEKGDFYASSGVSLKSLIVNEKEMVIEIDPEEGESYLIEFIGTIKDADLNGEPIVDNDGKPLATTFRYSSEIGKVLSTVNGNRATYTFQGNELYVRARITSSTEHQNPSEIGDKKQAWVQPVSVD